MTAPGGTEPGSLLPLSLRPGEAIVWSGRPRVGLAAGDGESAAVAAVVTFAAVGAATAFGVDARAGIAPLGLATAGLAACVLGLALTAARVAGAGRPLTLGFASLAPVFAVAAARGGWDRAAALACPAGSLALLAVWVALRFVEHRARRYHLSPGRAFVEEPGRYVISFELEGAPVARPSRLSRGRLGYVLLNGARGQLRTKRGEIFPVPAGPRAFVRVPFPQEAVESWESARSQVSTPARQSARNPKRPEGV